MKILVNGKEIEVSGQQPLIEELRKIGYDVPSLCYSSDDAHQASCMVCMVKNVANGQMIPSCSTFPQEGMSIETDTEEVLSLRKMSLELLLSDHRADCEAPCTIVSSSGIDVAQILLYYDKEIPYSVEVRCEAFKETDKQIHINAVIYVERDSQKGIIIGHQGVAIKKVNTEARKALEKFFDKHVFLEVFVKVDKDWRSNQKELDSFGYNPE